MSEQDISSLRWLLSRSRYPATIRRPRLTLFPIANCAPFVLLAACTSSQVNSTEGGADAMALPADGSAATKDAPPDAAPKAEGGAVNIPDLLPSQLPEGYECEPTLESLGPAVFETSCIFDTCHGDNDAAWGLRFTGGPEEIAAAVIGVQAGTCPDWLLVAPGEPERSLLWDKLARSMPACGEPMPRGIEPLPERVIDCIGDWITNL